MLLMKTMKKHVLAICIATSSFVPTYAMEADERSLGLESTDSKAIEEADHLLALELADMDIMGDAADHKSPVKGDGHECGDVKRVDVTPSNQPNRDQTDTKVEQPQAPKKSGGAINWLKTSIASLWAEDTSPLPTLDDINALLKTRRFQTNHFAPAYTLEFARAVQHDPSTHTIFCMGTTNHISDKKYIASIEYRVGVILKPPASIYGINFRSRGSGFDLHQFQDFDGIEHLLLCAALMDAWQIDPSIKEINYLHHHPSFGYCAARDAFQRAGLKGYSSASGTAGMRGDLKTFVDKKARSLFKRGKELFEAATTPVK